MKNGIVYVVNDNELYVSKMLNSIKSFTFFNKKLKDIVEIIVLTDKQLNLGNNIDGFHIRIFNDLSYDYASLPMTSRHTKYTYYRYELFCNNFF